MTTTPHVHSAYRYCPVCASSLAFKALMEDSGLVERLRCTTCEWTHWNNPTPVLAAIVQVGDKVLLARNVSWSGRVFALITGFMEAGESPEAGIAREVKEETNLDVTSHSLIGVYDFQRMNQVIIVYHVKAEGDIRLSPELAEYKLFAPQDIVCWPAGTGFGLAAWLRSQGIEPQFMEWPKPTQDTTS
jgi:NAD+ diphosphatase